MNSKFKVGDILRDLAEAPYNYGYVRVIEIHYGYVRVIEIHIKNNNYIVHSYKSNKILNWDRADTEKTCELATNMDITLYF